MEIKYNEVVDYYNRVGKINQVLIQIVQDMMITCRDINDTKGWDSLGGRMFVKRYAKTLRQFEEPCIVLQKLNELVRTSCEKYQSIDSMIMNGQLGK